MSNPLKGHAVIGQSGGPTAVINQSLVGIVEEARKHACIDGIYGALHGVRGLLDDRLVDLRAESAATLERVAGTPASALGSVRKKPTREECERIANQLRERGVRYVFYIGGNDSAETAHLLAELGRGSGHELRVFHVPKTIDNDLLVTDHCPGFGSAARFVAAATIGDNLDNRSLPGVKINVVMGRHAGFLTAATALARVEPDDGPHLIYLPETTFDVERFLGDVERVVARLKRCVIAVSEGIHDADGRLIVEGREKDSHGNVQLSGSGALGDLLADHVKKRLGESARVRADTFGYLQRSFPGFASEVDANEARRVGVDAVRAAVSSEHTSGSIALRRTSNAPYAVETFVTPLASVAKNTKSFPAEWIVPAGNDVTSAWLEYVRPLVGKLPDVALLARVPVPPLRS
ncbi:MAG: 6-phosphofructokinase [Planctomycetes bacterium]|nr:6-phosphofructokinase [Planctomycetota bacterium]